MSGESLPSGVLKVAELLPTLKRAMQTLSDNIRRRQGAEQVREGIQRAMGDLQTVHMALHEAGTRCPECGWMRGHDYGCPRDPLNPGASPPPQTTGAQPHPEPSEEASSLPDRITSYLANGGLFNPELADHDAVRDLLIDCRLQLNAMTVELVRAKAAAFKEALELSEQLNEAREHFAQVCEQYDAMEGEFSALKAAPVVDVERIMALAEAYADEVNKYLTCEPNDQVAAREALRAALASPEGSPR